MAECVCNVIIDNGTAIREDGQPTYEAKAAPGYDVDEAKWQIRKYFYDGNICVKWFYAEGDAGFNYKQSLEDTYTYTATGS